jgi:hypothetical protein
MLWFSVQHLSWWFSISFRPPQKKFRRRTLYYMRKSLGIIIFGFFVKKLGIFSVKTQSVASGATSEYI